jgi:hypothetical protein
LPFNPSPAANFTAQFSAKGLARAMFKPGIVIQLVAAPLIKAALDAACVHIAGGKMVLQDGDAYETCDTVGQSTQMMYQLQSAGVSGWYPSMQSACTNQAQQVVNRFSPGKTVTSATWNGYGTCVINFPGGQYNVGFTQQMQTIQTGPQPLTTDQAQARVEQTLQQWTQADFSYGYQTHNTPELLSELVQTAGVEPSGVSATGPTVITEPDQTTQTVNADGSKTITTTKVEHDITYSNPPATADGSPTTNTTINITYNTVTHTETKNVAADGTVTNGPKTDETKTDKPKTDDPCLTNPDRVGCATFGTPDKGPDIQRDAKTVQFQPVPFASASCPAPVQFDAFGQHYAFSYEPLCQKLQVISALLLALSGLAAAYIFVEGLKV